MTTPLQVTPGGLLAFGAECGTQSGLVVGAGAPITVPAPAMSQGTGQQCAALHALAAQVALMFGEHLTGLGSGVSNTAQQFSTQEAGNSDVMKQVGDMVETGVKTAADTVSPMTNLASSAANVASSTTNTLVQGLTHGAQSNPPAPPVSTIGDDHDGSTRTV